MRASAPRARCAEPRAGREGRGFGAEPGDEVARQNALKRRRGADLRIFAVEPGGRGADVPRRGAAAHSRRRDPRRADPRQAVARRLARPCRKQPVAVRQRRDLGPRADRAPRGDVERADAQRRADPSHSPQRRADHPSGRRRRHAAHGPTVRHRPHHRGGDQREPRARGARLHLLLRHAGGSGDNRRVRGALSRRIRARRPRHRPSLAQARDLRGPRHLDQALGAPSALSTHQARARDERTLAAHKASCGAGEIARHRPQHRR